MVEESKKSFFFQLAWKIAAFCGLIFIIGCFFTDPLSWGLGVLLGGGFTVIRLKMMETAVRKSIQMEPKKASRYYSSQYVIRYLLSAAVLAWAALEPAISLWGTILALLSLKAATYLQGILEKPTPKDGSVVFQEWVDEEDDEDEDWNRWETYNLKAHNKERKFQERNKIYKEQAVDARSADEGEQLSLFEEESEKEGGESG